MITSTQRYSTTNIGNIKYYVRQKTRRCYCIRFKQRDDRGRQDTIKLYEEEELRKIIKEEEDERLKRELTADDRSKP